MIVGCVVCHSRVCVTIAVSLLDRWWAVGAEANLLSVTCLKVKICVSTCTRTKHRAALCCSQLTSWREGRTAAAGWLSRPSREQIALTACLTVWRYAVRHSRLSVRLSAVRVQVRGYAVPADCAVHAFSVRRQLTQQRRTSYSSTQTSLTTFNVNAIVSNKACELRCRHKVSRHQRTTLTKASELSCVG